MEQADVARTYFTALANPESGARESLLFAAAGCAGTNMADAVPGMGHQIKFLLLGGQTVNENALLRFYVLHCVVLPLFLTMLVSVHIWRVRKDGGIFLPDPQPDDRLPPDEVA